MYYSVTGANVSFGENTVLENISFEIRDGEKIAVVGRNGCGKTTFLKLISGIYEPDNRCEINRPADMTVGYLDQMTFEDDSVTLETELEKGIAPILNMEKELAILSKRLETDHSPETVEKYTSLQETFRLLGGYYCRKELETVIHAFGFSEAERKKRLYEFSGGQRTKIAFIKLLVSKPDILLLDEPTNHLDIETTEWLEGYISSYPRAVVIVSHDRTFLDRTVGTVYEIEYGRIKKYAGNYSRFKELKQAAYEKQQKDFDNQQKEIARISAQVEKFRYKATKAAFAQSKIKYLERMDTVAPPDRFDLKAFYSDLTPVHESGGDVFNAKNLKIGYGTVLSEISFDMKKHAKIGVIGANGLGKSTFLKTVCGLLPPLGGSFSFGTGVVTGYFDQQMASAKSGKTVFDDYADTFPTLTETEVRTALGAFLFTGEDVFKTLGVLSGGERVRLALCKIFKRRPNFLILDEPTNHMDIVGKEALEKMLSDYTGSLLCVSHDRYFLSKVCDSLLVFDKDGVTFCRFGYDEYLKQKEKKEPAEKQAEPKKEKKEKYISPLKAAEQLKRKTARLEEKIALKEEELAGIKQELSFPENASDYLKLSELSKEAEEVETELSALMTEWEELAESSEKLQ